MIRIHLEKSRYRAPDPYTDTDGQVYHWNQYTNAARLATLRHAIDLLSTKMKNHAPCNAAFKALPAGRTFKSILEDSSIWLSYDPGASATHAYGITTGKNVAISELSFRLGIWTVAGTLVHELAHVDGAPGSPSNAAEHTLLDCLLPNVYNPGIVGQLVRPGTPGTYTFVRGTSGASRGA